MSLDKAELKQLLDRVIFHESTPEEWIQDVWELNPVMGENAANLYEVYEALIEHCPAERLEALWQQLYTQSQVLNN
jgi:hypothetical protein